MGLNGKSAKTFARRPRTAGTTRQMRNKQNKQKLTPAKAKPLSSTLKKSYSPRTTRNNRSNTRRKMTTRKRVPRPMSASMARQMGSRKSGGEEENSSYKSTLETNFSSFGSTGGITNSRRRRRSENYYQPAVQQPHTPHTQSTQSNSKHIQEHIQEHQQMVTLNERQIMFDISKETKESARVAPRVGRMRMRGSALKAKAKKIVRSSSTTDNRSNQMTVVQQTVYTSVSSSPSHRLRMNQTM